MRLIFYLFLISQLLNFLNVFAQKVIEDSSELNSIKWEKVEEKSKSLNISETEVLDKMKSLVPASRLGQPKEYGYLISFLSSDNASYINGASIPIDGGLLKSY